MYWLRAATPPSCVNRCGIDFWFLVHSGAFVCEYTRNNAVDISTENIEKCIDIIILYGYIDERDYVNYEYEYV